MKTAQPTNKEIIQVVRKILKRAQTEICVLHEQFGHTEQHRHDTPFPKYVENGLDTFTISFEGKKPPTEIPDITIVWSTGHTEKHHYTKLRDLSRERTTPVYLFCPINPKTIQPPQLREKVLEIFKLYSVQYITSENA